MKYCKKERDDFRPTSIKVMNRGSRGIEKTLACVAREVDAMNSIFAVYVIFILTSNCHLFKYLT